jgi:hypothetical protein
VFDDTGCPPRPRTSEESLASNAGDFECGGGEWLTRNPHRGRVIGLRERRPIARDGRRRVLAARRAWFLARFSSRVLYLNTIYSVYSKSTKSTRSALPVC